MRKRRGPRVSFVCALFLGLFLDGKRLKRINLASSGLHKLQVIPVASFPGVRHGTVLLRVVSSGKPVRIEGLGVSRA